MRIPVSGRRADDEQPRERRLRVRGVELCAFEWAGDGPPLLFVHATGFHARCWDEVIRRLPGRRSIAVDMRGHGRSGKPAPPYHWADFGEDVAALATTLELTGVVAVGHSMGGHSVIYAADREPERFAALLLVDPVVRAPERYRAGHDPNEPDASFVARRRNEWSSPDEMIERFTGRPPFDAWEPQVLEDYCRYGLLPAPGEGYVLACPPAVEADIYRHATETDVHDAIARMRIPVRVLRAPPPAPGARTFSGSPTLPDLASRFPRGEDAPLATGTHFIPMESPGMVARHVAEVATLGGA